jgi:DNA-binding NtrC family response regulator
MRDEPYLGKTPDILLVEDDHHQRVEFEDFFRRIGVTWRSADNGLAAIRLLEEITPKIALLDIRLPGASGIEVSKAILRHPARPAVVLMSGHIESVFEANQSPAKIFRVVEKPIDLRVLSRFIHQVLARPEGRPPARR